MCGLYSLGDNLLENSKSSHVAVVVTEAANYRGRVAAVWAHGDVIFECMSAFPPARSLLRRICTSERNPVILQVILGNSITPFITCPKHAQKVKSEERQYPMAFLFHHHMFYKCALTHCEAHPSCTSSQKCWLRASYLLSRNCTAVTQQHPPHHLIQSFTCSLCHSVRLLPSNVDASRGVNFWKNMHLSCEQKSGSFLVNGSTRCSVAQYPSWRQNLLKSGTLKDLW